jgi:hypothetical protein
MLTNFESIPENSKVWIYPASRKLYPQEIPEIKSKLEVFLKNWAQNNQSIPSTYKLVYDRFIVVFTSPEVVLETTTIDQLVGFILQLQKEYELELLDKMNVCFKQGAHVQYKDLKSFKQLVKNRSVNRNTIVFDNRVATKIEFDNFWEIPASESWYDNLF